MIDQYPNDIPSQVPPVQKKDNTKKIIIILVVVIAVLILLCICIVVGIPAILALLGPALGSTFNDINNALTTPAP
jgi:hypothetical protein